MTQTSIAKNQKRCSSEQDKNCPPLPSTPFSLTIPQSLSLTLSKASAVSSTAHCPWRTSSANRQILLLTSSVELVLSGSIFRRGYSETGHLTHSVTPWPLQFSLFWPACCLCPKPSSHSELCCSPHTEKGKTDHITPKFQFLHWFPIQQRIQHKINTLCYKCITGTAPSYLCDCLQLYTPSCTLLRLMRLLQCLRRLYKQTEKN